MATPFGRFKWKRLPFGVSPAPEIFQQKLDEVLSGLVGVKAIADDILVMEEGESYEEAEANHDVRFLKLLDRCEDRGLVLNAQKLRFKEKETPYIGHVLSDKGLQVAPKKVKAIRNAEVTECA